MARLIQSIFSGGGKSGFDDEELARYQAALQRGIKYSTGTKGSPVVGAAGGLLNELVRSKFFPTEGERAEKIVKEESVRLAQALDPAKYPEEYKLELGKRLAEIGNQQGNSTLVSSGVNLIQKTNQDIREGRAKRVQDRKAEVELQQANIALRRQEKVDKYAESGGMGAIPDKETQESFKKDLRTEYLQQTEAFMTRRTGMEAVRALANQGTRQAHLRLVIASLKVLEPNSAVLSEEQRIATDTAAARQKLESYLNMLQETKGNLTPEQVAEIVTSTEAVYKEFRKITAEYHQSAKALYDSKIPNGNFKLEIAPYDIPEALSMNQQDYIKLYEDVEDRNKAAAQARENKKLLEQAGKMPTDVVPKLSVGLQESMSNLTTNIGNLWHAAKQAVSGSEGTVNVLAEEAVAGSAEEVQQQKEMSELEQQLRLLEEEEEQN